MGLRGHLRLVCERDDTGRSVLREQSFAAPVHIGKSFTESGCCLLNVVCPTAGLLSGDCIEWDVTVRANARLILTSPSASRVHAMTDGLAEFRQTFRVAAGAWLEVNPEIFIPQKDAHHRQTTRIDLEKGGGLLFLETLAPGRVASGETFAFRKLEWDTQVRRAGELILKERYDLGDKDNSLTALQSLWPISYYASLMAIHPGMDVKRVQSLAEKLTSSQLAAGAGQLAAGGVVIKLLSASHPALRTASSNLRSEIYRMTSHPEPSLRRGGA